MKPRFKWLAKIAAWVRDGRQVQPGAIREAADAVVAQSQADIALIAERIASGEDLVTIRADFQRAVKRLDLAQTALARGGFDNLSAADLAASSARVVGQFEYLEGFLSDVAAGKVTPKRIAERAVMYCDAGRSTYENERMGAQKDSGMGEACRLLANLDHCGDCVEWAALGWIPIEEMESNYPIGASVCFSRCGCSIVYRRSSDSPSAPAVNRAIEAAQTKQAAYQAAKAAKESDE